MTSKHRHSANASLVAAGTVDTDITAAIAAHVKAYHTAPTPSPTLDTTRDGWAKFGPYIVGDPGDRLDSDFMGNLSQTVFNADGSVTLRCEKGTTPSGRPYRAGYLDTFATFDQLYGHFEAKLRWSAGQGYWPAFFLLPKGSHLPYPEIDIMEFYGAAGPLGSVNNIESTVHYAGEPVDATLRPSMWKIVAATQGAWHVVACDWSGSKVVFSLDGTPYLTVTTNIPTVPMHPVLMSGCGAGGFRADATTPALMTLDVAYVRVTA